MNYRIIHTSATTRIRYAPDGIHWEKLCKGRWVYDAIKVI